MDSSQLFSFCPPKDFSQRQPSLGYPGAGPPVKNLKIDSQLDDFGVFGFGVSVLGFGVWGLRFWSFGFRIRGLGSSVLEFRF